MREERFEVRVDGGTLAGCAAVGGVPALLLHGGPAIPDYMGCNRERSSAGEARLPVLIVHGVQSPLPIEGSGHFPWIEQPGAVRAPVERFL